MDERSETGTVEREWLIDTLQGRRDLLDSGRLPHDPHESRVCQECGQPGPCPARKAQQEEIRWIIDYLKSDLYERGPTLDTDPVGARWTSPIGWSVWFSYGFDSVPLTIRDPKGEPFASTTHGSREWLDGNLP